MSFPRVSSSFRRQLIQHKTLFSTWNVTKPLKPELVIFSLDASSGVGVIPPIADNYSGLLYLSQASRGSLGTHGRKISHISQFVHIIVMWALDESPHHQLWLIHSLIVKEAFPSLEQGPSDLAMSFTKNTSSFHLLSYTYLPSCASLLSNCCKKRPPG